MEAPSVKDEQLISETLVRASAPLSARERIGEAVVGGGFLLTTVALLIAFPTQQHFDPITAVLCVGVLALSTRVHFYLPSGYTVPSQLVFVPLVFVVPPTLVPYFVVVALALAALPELVRGDMRVGRLFQVFGNSWFAVGPAAVFAITNTDPDRAALPLLLLALAAQITTDAIASTVRQYLGRGISWREQIGDMWVYGVDAGLAPIGIVIAYKIDSSPFAILALLPLLWILSMFGREREARLTGVVELMKAYHGTALLLGELVEADDNYTGEHCREVVELALEVADELGLPAEQRRNLEFGALLHDVGKVAIPKAIINKPGTLDPEEWLIVKTHTLEGHQMLQRIGGFMGAVGLIVRSHHERWDGTGYPDQLAGEEIPLESRIIACCDTWNAMRTSRSYRQALSFDAALREMEENSGTQLDPRIVEALRKVVLSHQNGELPSPRGRLALAEQY